MIMYLIAICFYTYRVKEEHFCLQFIKDGILLAVLRRMEMICDLSSLRTGWEEAIFFDSSSNNHQQMKQKQKNLSNRHPNCSASPFLRT